ncbi:Asp23/Gls24 family envelope stress response protein [Streptomyces subrutilus]|uniref:Asp23/Gls24 family envelope stress response protein n=1 Tax=Streptomyces subrutilus TaxID=36818 RepID=UPI0033CAA14F
MTAQHATATPGASTRAGEAGVPSAERGATVIPEKVVARIAARAAKEALADRTDAAAAPVKPATPRASATVGGGSARLELSVELPYPADLARTSRQIQHYVSERVAHLTGMRVTEVTLAIERLVPATGVEHRRVQ